MLEGGKIGDIGIRLEVGGDAIRGLAVFVWVKLLLVGRWLLLLLVCLAMVLIGVITGEVGGGEVAIDRGVVIGEGVGGIAAAAHLVPYVGVVGVEALKGVQWWEGRGLRERLLAPKGNCVCLFASLRS